MAQVRDVTNSFSSGINSSTGLSTVKNSLSTIKNLGQNISTLSTQLNLLGIDAASIFTNETQYEDLLNATGNAALNYLNSKINRIKDAWNTKVEISVKALMGEVAPYVTNFGDASKLLVTKVDNLIGYITGTDASGSGSLLENLGKDALNYMASDSSLQSTLSGLSIIRTFGDALSIYDTVSNIVSKILKITETLIPTLQISTNLVLSYFTAGASTAEASQEITELAEHYCQQLIALAIKVIKKYVYNIKIKVPALFVGALNSISVREAMLSVDDTNGWLKAIFSEDFYENTLYSLQWEDSINQAIQTTLGAIDDTVNDWSNFKFTNSNGDPISRGEFMKSKFISTLTSKFLRQAVATARKTAYIRSFENESWTTKYKYDTLSSEYSTSDTGIQKTDRNYELSKLDLLLEDDKIDELSPITDLLSIKVVSAQLIANL